MASIFFPTQPSLFRRAIPSLQRSKNTPQATHGARKLCRYKLRSERFLHVGIATFSHKTHKVFFFGNVQNRRCVGKGLFKQKIGRANWFQHVNGNGHQGESSNVVSISQRKVDKPISTWQWSMGSYLMKCRRDGRHCTNSQWHCAVHHVIPTTSGPEWRNSI